MIRTLIVADTGAAMASATATLCELAEVDIVAYASGRARVDTVVGATAPDVAFVDEMRGAGQAAERIREVRAAGPDIVVVGLTARPDSDRALAMLAAGASTVVPHGLEPATLDQILREVLGRPRDQHLPQTIERSAA